MSRLYVPNPIDTIQGAIDNAYAGDTILIAPGTYYEDLVINTPNLRIVSESGYRDVVLKGTITIDVATYGVTEIRNLVVEAQVGGLFMTPTNQASVRLYDCKFVCSSGSCIEGPGGMAYRCEITGTGSTLVNGSVYMIMCLFHAINATDAAASAYGLQNCTFYDVSVAAGNVADAEEIISCVASNVSVQSGHYVFSSMDYIEYSTVWGISGGGEAFSPTADLTDCREEDPKLWYSEAEGFYLAPTSPCIGTGTATGAGGIHVDYNRVLVTTPMNRGCLQYRERKTLLALATKRYDVTAGIEVYDTATSSWVSLPSFEVSVRSADHLARVIDNAIAVSGIVSGIMTTDDYGNLVFCSNTSTHMRSTNKVAGTWEFNISYYQQSGALQTNLRQYIMDAPPAEREVSYRFSSLVESYENLVVGGEKIPSGAVRRVVYFDLLSNNEGLNLPMRERLSYFVSEFQAGKALRLYRNWPTNRIRWTISNQEGFDDIDVVESESDPTFKAFGSVLSRYEVSLKGVTDDS